MRKTRASRLFRAGVRNVIGSIPYSVAIWPSLRLKKEDGYRLTSASPAVELALRSLDRIVRVKAQAVRPWIEYQGPGRHRRDSHVSLAWNLSEGWWIEGKQTGRRTRPMPRLVGALLCGVLIWVYPDILKIVLAHAETTERFFWAYGTLALGTIVLASLIAFYLWLGFKSGPSGLGHALREFAKNMRTSSDEKEADESKEVSATQRD